MLWWPKGFVECGGPRTASERHHPRKERAPFEHIVAGIVYELGLPILQQHRQCNSIDLAIGVDDTKRIREIAHNPGLRRANRRVSWYSLSCPQVLPIMLWCIGVVPATRNQRPSPQLTTDRVGRYHEPADNPIAPSHKDIEGHWGQDRREQVIHAEISRVIPLDRRVSDVDHGDDGAPGEERPGCNNSRRTTQSYRRWTQQRETACAASWDRPSRWSPCRRALRPGTSHPALAARCRWYRARCEWRPRSSQPDRARWA